VRGRHVGDRADRGAGDARQRVDLPGVVHAELDHQRLVARLEPEDRQREPDVVVQVPRRAPHAPARGLEHARAQLLGGGLAVRAGDRDDGPRELRAPCTRQGSERRHGVADHDRGQLELRVRCARDQRGRCTARGGLGHEVVAVERLALHRDEERARAERARVGRDTRDLALRRAQQSPARLVRQLAEPRLHAASPRARSAASASSRSSKGRFSRPTIW
jgi:hypothetical protein